MPVAGIRTVMVTTPALLGDLIKQLAIGRAALDIVGQLSGRRVLARRLQRLRPQLVIIGLRKDETDATIRALLAHLPDSKVIAISHDGRCIAGYELRLSRIKLSSLSPDGLVDFIGAAATDIDG
jgi:DNA-binding NarL/FixJ family response regulator